MKNKIILGALLLVGFASIAYAAFSQMLEISGTATATGDWSVEITGISEGAGTTAGVTHNPGSPGFTATSATFDVNLPHPGAVAVYEVTVANSGNIDAILDSITGLTVANSAAPTDLQFSISGVTEGVTELDAATNHVITVTVEWDPNSTGSPTPDNKTATLNFNYVQNT